MNGHSIRRRLALLMTLVASLLAALGVGAAEAGAGSDGNNLALAQATKDGSSVFRLSFQIVRETDDVFDNQNWAIAYASCVDCEATAIAIQVVLVESRPSTATPLNEAIAVNFECTRCETFASAHQFARPAVGMTLSEDGREELSEIKEDVQELREQDLSPAEMDEYLDGISERIRHVLDTELVPRDDDEDEDDEAENVTVVSSDTDDD